jgi:hypothetical protein
MLINLVYCSMASDNITERDVEDILEEARKFNLENGITGLLLYHQGEFIQILEGDKEVVEELYSRIKTDPRHSLAKLLESSPIEKRSFPTWQMAFKPLTKKNLDDFSAHIGLSEFDKLSKVHEDTSLANKLLKVIGDQMLREPRKH